MASFHYDVMLPKFGNKLKLLFTDTDSFCYNIPSDNLYKVLYSLKQYMDFSKYPKSHPLYDEKNKKIPGFFKDETKGIPITEFIGNYIIFWICAVLYYFFLLLIWSKKILNSFYDSYIVY